MDLPGYRYDAALNRYFKIGGEPYRPVRRIVPSDTPSPPYHPRKKSKIVAKHGDRIASATVSGIPRALQLRQTGLTENRSFTNSLTNMKISQFKPSYNQKVSLTLEISTCDYMQGHQDYLIGAWAMNEESQDLVIKGECVNFNQVGNEISLDSYFSDENCVIARLHKYQVLRDMCVGDLSRNSLCVAYVSRSDISPENCMSSVVCYAVSRAPGDNDNDIFWSLTYSQVSESCAFGSIKKCIAVGADKGIRLYDLSSPIGTPYFLGGFPFSMNFSSDNNLLYCGLHNGKLVGIDLRTTYRSAPAIQISLNRGLFNFKLLKNQNSIITSSFDDQISNVDIRTKQVVFHYPYHVNRSKKLLPLSYDETWNVLCSAGEDNVTRLWSLKEGNLLLSVPAPLGAIKGNLHKSWFHSTSRGPLLHLWQGHSVYLYKT